MKRPPLCESCQANGWRDCREKLERYEAAVEVTMETRGVLVEEQAALRERMKHAVALAEEVLKSIRNICELKGPALKFHVGLIATDLSRAIDMLR